VLTGSAAEHYRRLCAELAHAHHGVRAFDQLGSRLMALQPGSLLRTREAKLDRAIVECGEMRARMLERYARAP
jgi:hypothetical protein